MICTCIVCGEILLSHHVMAPTTDPERAIMFRDLCARIVGHITPGTRRWLLPSCSSDTSTTVPW